MLSQIRTLLSVIIIVALLLSNGLLLGERPAAAADGEELDLPPIELPEKGNPKLDSQLNQLVSAQTPKRAASFAQESNIELVDDNVRVIVECLPGQVDAAVKAAGALGVVETSYRNLLQAVVPITSLTALADTPGIRLVRMPWYPLPDVVSVDTATVTTRGTLEDGLVAYYPFNGNADDESGNGNNGTVYGATLTEDRFGNANSAYSFDGVDDYVEVPDNDTLDLSDGLTISAWINSSDTSGARDIVAKWGAGLKRSYVFKDHNWSDKLRIELSEGGLSVLASLEGTSSITIGNWVHVCATYDSTTVKLYFNGTQDAALPASGIIASGDASLIIGGVIVDSVLSECFWGILDDIRIYNRALSEYEIQELYTPPVRTSEGVELINADEVQTAGYTGAGVKVAILDGGFTGYADLLGTELPASVTTQSFYAGSDIEGYTAHGTACAEIVYDIAPAAQFHLVNFGTEVELGNAVDWLIAQGVDVISFSMGDPIGGPGDGTGLICEMVDAARAAGILWSQSMGNYAERHWQGDFVDPNTNGWHDFNPGVDESNAIYVIEGEPIIVSLKWDDPWGASNNDYDLGLIDPYDTLVAASVNPQYDAYNDPIEWLVHIAEYSGYYHILIASYASDETANFHLYSGYHYHDLQYQVASSSFAIPADSPNAMAVGAVPWNNPTALESFSSRGPTKDGRVKPDLVAPDGVSTATYGTTGFYGTSASAPHAAGAAALLLDKDPAWSVAQVRYALESTADKGASGQDNLYGWGLVDAYAAATGFDPPTMEPVAEAEGQYYNTAPSFSNFGFDDDVALDDGWYQMDSFAGAWTALFTDVAGTSWDNDGWTIPGFDGLAEGSHTIYFKASDDTDNVEGESGEWGWQFFKDTTVPTVGGTIVLVDKLELVMPWIIVTALMAVAGTWLGIWNRKRGIGSPSGR